MKETHFACEGFLFLFFKFDSYKGGWNILTLNIFIKNIMKCQSVELEEIRIDYMVFFPLGPGKIPLPPPKCHTIKW